MKKIKIMLLAIAVIGTIAGTLAFKARNNRVCVYSLITATNIEFTWCPFVGIAFIHHIETLELDPLYYTFVTTRSAQPFCQNISIECQRASLFLNE